MQNSGNNRRIFVRVKRPCVSVTLASQLAAAEHRHRGRRRGVAWPLTYPIGLPGGHSGAPTVCRAPCLPMTPPARISGRPVQRQLATGADGGAREKGSRCCAAGSRSHIAVGRRSRARMAADHRPPPTQPPLAALRGRHAHYLLPWERGVNSHAWGDSATRTAGSEGWCHSLPKQRCHPPTRRQRGHRDLCPEDGPVCGDIQ